MEPDNFVFRSSAKPSIKTLLLNEEKMDFLKTAGYSKINIHRNVHFEIQKGRWLLVSKKPSIRTFAGFIKHGHHKVEYMVQRGEGYEFLFIWMSILYPHQDMEKSYLIDFKHKSFYKIPHKHNSKVFFLLDHLSHRFLFQNNSAYCIVSREPPIRIKSKTMESTPVGNFMDYIAYFREGLIYVDFLEHHSDIIDPGHDQCLLIGLVYKDIYFLEIHSKCIKVIRWNLPNTRNVIAILIETRESGHFYPLKVRRIPQELFFVVDDEEGTWQFHVCDFICKQKHVSKKLQRKWLDVVLMSLRRYFPQEIAKFILGCAEVPPLVDFPGCVPCY